MEKTNFLTTNQLASRLGVQGATIRRGLCVNGHYMGLRPGKLPNNRLLWSEAEADHLILSNSESVCSCKADAK